MPETNEEIGFDEFGVCKACVASEEKMKINWKKRQIALKTIKRSKSKIR